MENRIPAELQQLMHDYDNMLQAEFGEMVHGIYLYGSIAWGAYTSGKSDIDFLTVTKGRLDDSELNRLRRVHAVLKQRYPEAKRMDGMYIELSGLGKLNEHLEAYPCCRNGTVEKKRGYWDLNHVTWWTLQQQGITVSGVDAKILPFAVTWQDVISTMRYNVEEYWANKAKSSYLFLMDEWVEFAIITISRILYTLEQRTIIGKEKALVEMLQRLPEEWHPMLKEALRLWQKKKGPPIFASRIKRAKSTKAFILYVSQCCEAEFRKGVSKDETVIH